MISGKKTLAAYLNLAAVAVLGMLSGPAAAESELTPMEWAGLPDYCKSAILQSGYHHIIPSSNTLTGAWARAQGFNEHGLAGAHHFCMGLVYMDRAKMGRATFKDAIGELNYSQSQMDISDRGYPYATSYLAMAHYRAGNRLKANSLWQGCIQTHPQNRYCYLSMADALIAEKRPQQALDLLLKYDEVKEGEYPDAEHFIARAYYDTKRYPEALKRAERASELGYPVSGLRDKLRAIVAGTGKGGK